ncbi:hypothetical protein Ct9H90mP29_20080 [bacterium]|nr:MAG: hypothetical protein Ct9H90mP29_20080 [bacterium]
MEDSQVKEVNETVPYESGYDLADQKLAKGCSRCSTRKETGSFNSFNNEGDIENWVSVFGTKILSPFFPSDAGDLDPLKIQIQPIM